MGQKHKSAICDRTPHHLHIKSSLYVCRRVQGSQIFKQLKYLDPFKSYCIFSNCKWPPPWRHPCLSCLTCVCMSVCLHGALHIPTPTHTPIHPPHLPPNQLKCYNCYIGINLDPSKPKGMPLGLKLHSAQLHTASLPNAKPA